MNGKPRVYLDLVRTPNLFTAAADILAGFLYSGADLARWTDLVGLLAASVFLYAGGVALNDVCDVARDSDERPERPIPSGRISRRAALRLTVALLIIGFGFAALTSTRAAMLAGLLIVGIVLYNAVFKSTPVAPAVMGLCRALNLALGMHAAGSLWTAAAMTPIGLVWLYVASITFFARHEAGVSSSLRLTAGTIGVCAAVAGLSAMAWIVPLAQVSFLWPLGLLLVVLGYEGFRAVSRPSPSAEGGVQAAVKTFVISLILFDACIAWAARGPLAAFLVALLVVPTILLARILRVT
ncbi:MAG: UbiA family prenyltransferase [Planctomycetota bacterium]